MSSCLPKVFIAGTPVVLINNFNILASFRMIASPSIFCNLIATGLFLYICRPLYNFPNAPSPISDSITYLLFMSIIKDNK